MLLVVLLVCAVLGWLISSPMERVVIPPLVRRRVGVALLCAVALLPVGGGIALAASSRGFTGEISHFWSTVTNPNGGTGDQPGRLVQLSNSRPHYWSVGLKVGAHHPLIGAGELGFSTAYTRYSADRWAVGHAHSYVVQTFADLGAVGIVLSLALLLGWAAAAARPVRARSPAATRRADRDAHAAHDRGGVRAALADRLDLVHPRDRGHRARVRGVAGRTRAAGGEG